MLKIDRFLFYLHQVGKNKKKPKLQLVPGFTVVCTNCYGGLITILTFITHQNYIILFFLSFILSILYIANLGF